MPSVLAIPGSLRAASANPLLILAALRLAPPTLRIDIDDVIGRLPHFNPDHDGDSPPPAVLDFRRRVGAADALMISSPEYAHGIPGSLKNALDWLVSSVEFPGKPVLLVNASAGDARHLQMQLTEVLATMSARVIARPPMVSAVVRRAISADGTVDDPHVAEAIAQAITELGEALPR